VTASKSQRRSKTVREGNTRSFDMMVSIVRELNTCDLHNINVLLIHTRRVGILRVRLREGEHESWLCFIQLNMCGKGEELDIERNAV
jgi:hypothetical protein